MKRSLTLASVLFIALFLTWETTAMAGDSSKDPGVLSLVPGNALAVLEHVGHATIRPVFLKSNTGKMAMDEAMNQFIHDSRVQFGKMAILKNLYDFDGGQPDQLNAHHKQLHEMLKPFWHDPAAVFLLPKLNKDGKPKLGEPQLGAVCIVAPGRLATAKKAMDFFRGAQAAKPGEEGTRQCIEWTHKVVRWRGVLKRDEPFAKPEKITEAELRKGNVFLYTWRSRILYVAFSADAAIQISEAMTNPEKDPRSKAVQVVLDKTKMADWAFRWYVDLEKILGMAMKEADAKEKKEIQKTLQKMGVNKFFVLGGSMGYINNILARRTFLYAPGTTEGFLRLLQPGGDYRKALKMAPPEQTITVAGKLDVERLKALIKNTVDMKSDLEDESRARAELRALSSAAEIYKAKNDGKNPPSLKALADEGLIMQRSLKDLERKYKYDPKTGTFTQIAVKEEKKDKPDPDKALEELLTCFDGRVALYVGDLQTMMMGTPPMGAVAGIKDAEKTRQAIQNLLKATEAPKELVALMDKNPAPASRPATDAAPGQISEVRVYRKVLIRPLPSMQLAILKDRLIVAGNDASMKAAIDAAKDGIGGVEKDSAADKLLAECGKGQGAVIMDLRPVVKLAWPMLMQAVQSTPEQAPLSSLPSTAKLVRMLDSEVAVFQIQSDGVMVESRGKVPFATKIIPVAPMYSMMFLFMMMAG